MPDQAAHFWPLIKAAYLEANPQTGAKELQIILQRLIGCVSQAWIISKGSQYEGCIVTTLEWDSDERKRLYVNALYLKSGMKMEIWKLAYNTISKFAIGEECEYGAGTTWVDGIAKAFKRLGASTYWAINWDFSNYEPL